MRSMRRTALPILALLTAGLLVAAFFFVRARRAPPQALPLPPSGFTQVDLPAPPSASPSGGIEKLRDFRRAGTDRFEVEAADEAIEKRLELLKPFLLAPPVDDGDLARRFPAVSELLPASLRLISLLPGTESRIHARGGVEAHAGRISPEPAAADGSTWLNGPVAFARELRRLIAPLDTLESAALKVISIEGRPEGPAESRILYQLAGSGPGGKRLQWNGRWRVAWAKELAIESITPEEATRVSLSAKPFEDVSNAALGGNPSYAAQLRPSLDYFRDRLDAATGIDVYGHHGIAARDLDGDGLEDIYLPEPPGLPSLVLRNRGDGTFEDISARSGADLLDGGSQPLLFDADNDGDADIFLVGEDGIALLKNDGSGHFAPHPMGLDKLAEARATTICAAAADYDLDGAVDVFVGSYVFWRGAADRSGSRLPFPYLDARNGAPNFLLKGRGDGTFEDATAAAGLQEGNDRFTFAAAWGDIDDDGWPDLAVANDFGKKNLYRNRGNGTFVEVTAEAGAEDLGAGMSASWEDFDNDGRLDLYFGNMYSTAGLRVTHWSRFKEGSGLVESYRKHARGNTLLRNRGDGGFDDVSVPTRSYMGRWSWASDFLDFNLDGREDIYIAAGFVTNPDVHDL